MDIRKHLWRGISLVLLINSASVSATTFISDTVHWGQADSPVVVAEDLVVQRGGTLQIDSGVEVLFAADISLIIQGDLEVLGGDYVHMARLEADRPWQGVKFDRTELGQVSLLDVSGASIGIYVSECYDLALSNIRVKGNSIGLRFDAPSGVRSIRNPLTDSVIEGNDYGIAHYSTGSSLIGNLIRDNGTGIYGIGGSCGGGGTCGWRISAYDNLVADNVTGVDLIGFNLVLRNNEIRGNNTGVQMRVYNGASIDAAQNNFEFNTDVAIRNAGFLDFDMGSVWFGTRDPSVGPVLVHDIYDDLNLGEALFAEANGRFDNNVIFDRRFLRALNAGVWADFGALEPRENGRAMLESWWLGADATESIAAFGTDPVIDFDFLEFGTETWAVALIRRDQGWVEVRAKDPQTDSLKGRAQFDSEYSPRAMLLPTASMMTLQEPAAIVVGVTTEGRPHAQLKSLASDAVAARTFFDSRFEFVAAALLPDMDGNGVEELAVLGKSSEGTYRAQVKDPMTGALIGFVFFDPAFVVADFKALEDRQNAAGPLLAVLGTDSVGRVRIQAKHVATGELHRIVYFDRRFYPSALAAFQGVDGTVLAVFGEDAAGIRRLQSKRLDDGATVGLVRYSSDFTPMSYSLLGDKDGNGVPEFAVLGYSTSETSRIQVKDPLTGNVVGNLFRD